MMKILAHSDLYRIPHSVLIHPLVWLVGRHEAQTRRQGQTR